MITAADIMFKAPHVGIPAGVTVINKGPTMHPFSLPLPNRPPTGFGSSDRSLLTAATSALETGIDERDIFLGIPRCTICGIGSEVLEHCHIIPLPEDKRIVSRNGI